MHTYKILRILKYNYLFLKILNQYINLKPYLIVIKDRNNEIINF